VVLLGPLSLILFLSLFGDLPWLAAKSSRGAAGEAGKLVAYGRERLREGNLQEAYQVFQSALRIDPQHAEAYGMLGQTCYAARDMGNAAHYLRQAVALDPPQKDLYLNNLGILYAQQGKLDTALVMFQAALSTGIKEAEVYRNIALLHRARGDTAAALTAYRAAVDHRSDVRRLYLEMLRRAEGEYRQDPETREQHRQILEALERGVRDEDLERYDRESFEAQLKASPETARHFTELAEFQQIAGDLGGALATLAQALAWNPGSTDLRLKRVALLQQAGRLEEARAEAEIAFRQDPSSEAARQTLNQVNATLAARNR